jgi:hypothetical protein
MTVGEYCLIIDSSTILRRLRQHYFGPPTTERHLEWDAFQVAPFEVGLVCKLPEAVRLASRIPCVPRCEH